MSPCNAIVARASETHTAVDDAGRTLTFRVLTALDKLRLLKAAGPDLSLNQPWLSVALLATSVVAIDDVPVPFPVTEAQIEGLVDRLGDSGIDAVADALDPLTQRNQAAQVAKAGNLFGTPS